MFKIPDALLAKYFSFLVSVLKAVVFPYLFIKNGTWWGSVYYKIDGFWKESTNHYSKLHFHMHLCTMDKIESHIRSLISQ